MNMFARYWAEFVLTVIVLAALGLSIVWIFRVPLLQNPDESSHIDYVFSIYSAGRLLNVRQPPSAWNVHPRFEGRKDKEGLESLSYDNLSHQYTLYLIDSTDFQRIRFHPDEKVPADYGTRAYYQNLEANAPQTPAGLPDLNPRDNPWMITAYPFLYYAVCAAFLKVLGLFGAGPVWLFLGARFLSALFFSASLIVAYAVLRELRLRKSRALLLTAILAFFPLCTFISAAVQPDNLALLLVLLCSYLTLRIARAGVNSSRLYLLLGLALGALLVTKYHIFLFTAVALLATLLSEHVFHRRSVKTLLRPLMFLLLPSVLLFAVQLWVVWGGGTITGSNLHPARMGLVTGIKTALYDYYRIGPAFVSWWGTFGWMDASIVIFSPWFQGQLWRALGLLTLLTLALVFFRFAQIAIRLIRVARRAGWRPALRLAFSNPLIVNHLLFSVFMVLLYAFTDNAFFAQGRHWFPYMLSSFFITTEFAPRVLPHRKLQRAVSTLLIIGLLIYCAVGAYFSLKTITDRYYPAPALHQK
jgi:4-amino-4-deoxy-L-arabinose transferase-like glycosyltransferase